MRVIHVASKLADQFGYSILNCECHPTIAESIWCKLALGEMDVPQIQADFQLASEESRLFGLLAA